MIDASYLNEAQLARIYLVANTPLYLYRHYRDDPSVHELVRKNTISDLVGIIKDIAGTNDRTLKEITLAYASLVALTFKNPKEVKAATSQVHMGGITWARAILAFGASQQASSQQFTVKLEPKDPQISTLPKSSDVASVVTRPEVI